MHQLLSIFISKCVSTICKTDHLCRFAHIINNIYTKYEIFFDHFFLVSQKVVHLQSIYERLLIFYQ